MGGISYLLLITAINFTHDEFKSFKMLLLILPENIKLKKALIRSRKVNSLEITTLHI